MKKYKNHISLLLAALCYTTLPIFIKILADNHLSLFAQNTFRIIIALIVLVFLLLFFTKDSFKMTIKELKYMIPNSFILLGIFVTISLSIYLGTSVAKATALVYAYSLTVVPLNYFFFGVKPTRKQGIAVFLSLISVALILQVWTISDITQLKLGDLFALSNSIFYGLTIVFGKKIRVDLHISPIRSLFLSLLLLLPIFIFMSFMLGTLFHVQLFSFQFDIQSVIKNIPPLFGLATFSTVIPLLLIYKSITKVDPTVASILLFTELIWISISGIIFFDQIPSIWTGIGIVGIISSLLLL